MNFSSGSEVVQVKGNHPSPRHSAGQHGPVEASGVGPDHLQRCRSERKRPEDPLGDQYPDGHLAVLGES